MEVNVRKKDFLFLLACLGLAILAEISFLHGRIGVSYLVFISVFYVIVFLRYGLAFNHRRIGLLFMIAIWILSGSYLFYDNGLLHNLNMLMVPILVFAHLVLITSPTRFKWNTPGFLTALSIKLKEARSYIRIFLNTVFKRMFKNMSHEATKIMKQVILGLLIGLPLLLFITGLLMSADAIFENVVLQLPQFFLNINIIEIMFRLLFIVFVTFLFFGIFQVLNRNSKSLKGPKTEEKHKAYFDSTTAITILVLVNAIYLLFVVIQFKYFFSSRLIVGMTFADYARRGFFELLIILLVNWTILISFLKWVKEERAFPKMVLKIIYSSLIVMSAVMLISAYQRLYLYESAYGFTYPRLIAHAFMLFLMVIFAYTLMRVWIERISLLHFYLIVGLVFYTSLNVIDIEQLIVDKNMKRYEETGKIDIHYLNSLSYIGWNGLIDFYKIEPHFPELKETLLERKERVLDNSSESWQSFNFAKKKVLEEFDQLDIEEDIQ